MEGSRNKDIPDGTVANGGRRYTFLVEKVDQYGMTLSVEGNIHGKICEDDGAYLYHAKLPITLAKIIMRHLKKLTMPLRGWLTRYFTDMKIKALIMPTSHLRNLIISML